MIGGNTTALLQSKVTTKNAFGEKITNWKNIKTLKGFLDYTGGNGDYNNTYKGEVEETTHIFICDFWNLIVAPTQCRLIIDQKVYDVLMIDNPMGLNKHLEIFLKYNEAITNG